MSLQVFQARTAPAFRGYKAALTAYGKAEGTMQSAVTLAFAAILAADHDFNPKDASKLLAARIADWKLTEGSANVMRTRAKTAFEEPGQLARLRAAVPNADNLSPDDFHAAVSAFAATFDVRAMERARKDKVKAATSDNSSAKLRQASVASDPAATPDATPLPTDPVLDAQNRAMTAIAELVALANAEGADDETRGNVSTALSAIFYASADALGLDISEPAAEPDRLAA